MRKISILAIAIIFSLTTNSYAQNSNIEYGIKAGANHSKFTPDFEVDGRDVLQYQRKVGFYLGGFFNVGISEKLQFQPELLFALQGTGVLIEDIELNVWGESPTLADFESNINESTLAVPLVFRYFFTEMFFMDGGPQLGIIINRNEKIKKVAFEQPGEPDEMEFDYDNFDLGITVGIGYKLSEDLIINGRFFFGLIERDNSIKSSVFNLGLEYKL
ncbi:MAG: porin family protein [Bacteroidota bacterium]